MVYHFLARTFLLPIFVFSYWRICYSQRFDHRGAKNNFLEKNAFRKVNSEVMVKPREIPASQIHTGPIILRCENHHKGFYFIRKQAYVTLQKIADFGFKPTEPYFYDVHGNRHSRPFMWVSSNNDFMCAINLKGMIISIKGAIFNGKDGVAVMWHHPSILGTHETAYYRNPDLLIGFGKAEREYLGDPKPNDTYNFIVPIRTRWDYCFHHFHIQTIPLIAAIYEFHQNEWEKITWHTSLHSAGVLSLMGVPLERMVIDTPIKAKRVLLPWYPNWNPLEVAAFKGITRRTCQLITEKVLEKHIDPTVLAKTYKIVVSIINPLLNNTYSAMAARGGDGNLQELLQTNDRLVIYFSRPPPKRAVVNEQELFAAIASSLLPGYRFLVIQSIPYVHNETIDMMHALWQQFARVVSRAKVLIGPHGKNKQKYPLSLLFVSPIFFLSF